MKFTKGYWEMREGLKAFFPAEVNDVEVKGNSLNVYAPSKHIQQRGDTLNCPLFTVEFTSPMDDVIRVRITHHKGLSMKQPSFELHEKDSCHVRITDEDEYVSLTSGNLTARVKKHGDWNVDFFGGGKLITSSGYKNMGYIVTEEGETYVHEQLLLKVGEYVYGLGERFTPFIKNGQVVDMWNEDGGTSSEIAYKNIPFYMTSAGYGVFVNHPEKVSFEIASEKVSRIQFSVPGEYLEYFVIYGSEPKKVLEKYTFLTGRPALPPAWSFGLWLSTSFTTNYDEETVNTFIDGMAQRDIPLHVFHFDCFWMKEFHWTNFEWDERIFPDPERMLRRLKEKGLRICLWINPYIAQRSRLFDEGMKKGYLIKKRNGDIWQSDMWQAGMGIVDFTNPEACEWYKENLRRLLDMGVDCFKTDFGERIPTDVKYYDGSDPMKMHNYYTFLYNKAVFEVLVEKYGTGGACVFARSATAGGQQFPVHWGGDCSASYESMAESLRGGLSLGMSGFGFWSHDISGFESTATPDLYKRWAAFGLLSSHSRLHGSSSYRVPWLFDEEAVDVVRYFTKLKCSLMPYLYANACEASQKGIPVLRSMVLEFPYDPTCKFLDLQYMLGSSLLVAPIFNDKGKVEYYLPEGRWTHLLDGRVKTGGRWVKEEYGYMSLPLWVRPNSILPIGAIDTKPDYDYSNNVTFHLFQINDGKTVTAEIPTIKGVEDLLVKAKREADVIKIIVNKANKPWNVLLRNIEPRKIIKGEKFKEDNLGVYIKARKGMAEIQVLV